VRSVRDRTGVRSVRTLTIGSTKINDETKGEFVSDYPFRKPNWLLNICPGGFNHVVERFGRYSRTEDAGLYFALPFVERITVHDMREITIEISPQSGVTRDNVYADVSGVLFVKVTDPVKASYGAQQPLDATVKAAEAAMRNALGSMDLDDCFRSKDRLNELVTLAVQEATESWGVNVTRYEVTLIDVPDDIRTAMNLQAAAERQRRETCLGAQADADVIRQIAEAKARATELDAEAQRVAQVKQAQGKAEALEAVGKVLSTKEGAEAAQLGLAQDYIKAFESTGQKSNTFFMNGDASDVAGMLAKGMAILGKLKMDSNTNSSQA
jgi:regulator of protease activity HflC (stomatin/prohibitin superfamily)